MKLTEEQKAVLEGERGKLLSRYLEWSILWGEALGATRLVPVTNVHCILRTPCLKGISERTLDTYLDEFRELCSHQVECITLTHANCTDLAALREKGLTEKELNFQQELHAMAARAGVRTTWSCAPYQVGAVPKFGEICAWTESSAVVYSNSMMGARTNRNGMESSLAAAFLGWVPEFGALLDQYRKAAVRVELQVDMKSVSDWGALGYYVGEKAGSRIPVFEGIGEIAPAEAKQLSASLPYAGRGTTMFHIAGLTPEAATVEDALDPHQPVESLTFDRDDLRTTYGKMNRMEKGEPIDTVALGCPFSSLDELRGISRVLARQHVAPGVKLIVCTSRHTLVDARRLGYAGVIEEAGGHILSDICPGALGHARPRNYVSNSFKQAFYGRSTLASRTGVLPLEGCVAAAVSGRWAG